MNQYYALIGDIIESRSLANRARMQEALSQALNGLNERYQGHLASCFSLTLGDEFQGLLKVGAPIFQMIDELRLALSEFVRSSWIQSQMETFRTILDLGYYQSRFDQKRVATALGLSSSAFAKRMKSSGIKLYLDVKNDLNQAIENLARQAAQGGEGA